MRRKYSVKERVERAVWAVNASFEDAVRITHQEVYSTQAEVFEIYERPLYYKKVPMKYENGIYVRDHHGNKKYAFIQCASNDEGAERALDDNGNKMMVRCNKDAPDAVKVLNEHGKPLLGWRLVS